MSTAISPSPVESMNTPEPELVVQPSKMLIWTTTLIYLGLLVYSGFSLPKLRDALGLEVGVFIPVWRGLVIAGGLFVLWSQLWRKTTVCVLGDKDVTCYRGIFSKASSTLPLVRIANVTHKKAWWKRLLGVSDIYFVATGDQAEMSVPWIANAEAQKLIAKLEARREALLAALGGRPPAGQ